MGGRAEVLRGEKRRLCRFFLTRAFGRNRRQEVTVGRAGSDAGGAGHSRHGKSKAQEASKEVEGRERVSWCPKQKATTHQGHQ